MSKVSSFKINHDLADEIRIFYDNKNEIDFIAFFYSGQPIIDCIEEFSSDVGYHGDLLILINHNPCLVYSFIDVKKLNNFIEKYGV